MPVRLRLRWGACKGILSQQVGSLSTAFLVSTKAIFSTKRQDHSPYKLVAAHHNLGSEPATPSHLRGKPPRVTNASKAFRREPQVLKLWDTLAQLTQAHKRLKLSTQHKDMAWIANLTKRELESVSLSLAYEKQQGKYLSNLRKQQLQQVELVGYLYPSQGNLPVSSLTKAVRPPGQGG
jgi:hypothetical protein